MRAATAFTDRWLDFIWRRHGLVLFLAALTTLVFALLATRLELRTNVAELLPSRDPAVEELQYLSKRIGGTSILEIAIESPDREANLSLAGKLTAELRQLPPDVIQSAVYDVRAEREFFKSRQWLYAPLSELIALRDSLKAEIRKKKNPLYVDILGEDEDPQVIVKRMRDRGGVMNSFPSGFLEGRKGRIVVIVCRPPGGLFAERAGERLADAARKLVAAANPTSYNPSMKVGLTGDVMSQIEERAALESDLVTATAVCIVLVCFVVIVFYGRFRAIPFVGIPALMGVAFAFGMAELLFGYLNASTAFMGSIVVGNGINFPIIQLARYEEERRSGKSPRDAAGIALAATIRPTAVAALGAAVAYASLIITRFRGFSQFGTIGGLGMVAAWAATVIVLPALWAAFDHRERTARRFAPPVTAFSDLVARIATQAPRSCLIVFGLLTVVSIVPLRRYLHDPFEYDFRNLRNKRSLTSGAARLAERVDPVFGHTLTPAVVIADERAHADEIRKKILDRDHSLPGEPMLGQVTILDDFLPGDIPLQKQKLAVLAELREIIDSPAAQLADERDREDLVKLRPPESLTTITDADLPMEVKRPFVENDGTAGRVVLVYHDAHVSVWDGRNLMRIADIIGEIPLDNGTVVRSSGHAVIFAAMIRSIVHDAPLATSVSFLAVALLVIVLAGRRGAALVLPTLVAGVLWMLGTAAWTGVRTNFLNFIAVPITFGIGVDYGINIYLRYQLEGRGRVGRAVRATGGAVALCSLTTIIGYAALLVADNQALRSFGEMAILGEVACLSAAVVGMPAFLVWLERLQQRRLDRLP
ncbi:MAG TPA: MMPL family transporter [Polyangia bacterium]|nr:MMPL family transporter [Polyangia bacterium]